MEIIQKENIAEQQRLFAIFEKQKAIDADAQLAKVLQEMYNLDY